MQYTPQQSEIIPLSKKMVHRQNPYNSATCKRNLDLRLSQMSITKRRKEKQTKGKKSDLGNFFVRHLVFTTEIVAYSRVIAPKQKSSKGRSSLTKLRFHSLNSKCEPREIFEEKYPRATRTKIRNVASIL